MPGGAKLAGGPRETVEMTYSGEVLHHYENPRNVGPFDKSD